jgi:Methyltransferase domain
VRKPANHFGSHLRGYYRSRKIRRVIERDEIEIVGRNRNIYLSHESTVYSSQNTIDATCVSARMLAMRCRICGYESEAFASTLVLSKFQVNYFRCGACRFIQTEPPYWLEEAYSEAIGALDVGVMLRNLHNAAVTSAVISLLFPNGTRFLDYAGGYGTLVRLMRDRGFDFYWSDRYAKNLHARGFEQLPGSRYDLLTAYEVLEHLPEPLDDIGLMLDLADNVLVSTEVVPVPAPSPPNWWYYAVKGGQHISFYAADSLQKIASHFHVHLLSRGSYHLFTRKPQNSLLFRIATSAQTVPIVNWLRKRESLIQADFERMAA